MCGIATTKKEAKTVVAKRDDVRRLRGWRCGGMFAVEDRGAPVVRWKIEGLELKMD